MTVRATQFEPAESRGPSPKESFRDVLQRATAALAAAPRSVSAVTVVVAAGVSSVTQASSSGSAVGSLEEEAHRNRKAREENAQRLRDGDVQAPGGGADSPKGDGADQMDLLEAQRLLNAEGASFNAAYLQMQEAMQQESRKFTAESNISKVRHDSAKAAINNIR